MLIKNLKSLILALLLAVSSQSLHTQSIKFAMMEEAFSPWSSQSKKIAAGVGITAVAVTCGWLIAYKPHRKQVCGFIKYTANQWWGFIKFLFGKK